MKRKRKATTKEFKAFIKLLEQGSCDCSNFKKQLEKKGIEYTTTSPGADAPQITFYGSGEKIAIVFFQRKIAVHIYGTDDHPELFDEYTRIPTQAITA